MSKVKIKKHLNSKLWITNPAAVFLLEYVLCLPCFANDLLMTLYREEFICVCVGWFLWKESLEYKDCSTSSTARNQEAASGSFSIWCFVLVHAYFRKAGNPSGMNKRNKFL